MTDIFNFLVKLSKGEYSLTIVTMAGVIFIIFLISRMILDWIIFKKQIRFSKLHEKKM